MTYLIKIVTIKADDKTTDQAQLTLNQLASQGFEVVATYGNGNKINVVMQKIAAN